MPTRSSTKKKPKPKREGTRRVVEQAIGEKLSGYPLDQSLRCRISDAVTRALMPLPTVFAGWEGGSAAFGAVDAYSDIDLVYIVADDAAFGDLYAIAERAIEAVSPITASYTPPLGRYYKLKDGGDFFLVDLIFFRTGETDHHLDIERHG